ncbi:MAG: isochorismate pyruvate lyase [Sphingomonadales bacterium]|jgi:isochorismate pyruvate lyase|nr:isochorismate pyruvate lyase [Sphingomonadales bacterium]MEA3034780.1 isochorismate pyruvate lyase [Sphingomonadales bacterium]
MTDERPAPDQCTTMREVRFGVDRVDEAILALIGERFRYMDAAARIKPERGAVRDEGRKAEVLGKVRRLAAEHCAPEGVIAELYERLIEASIAYEFDRFDALRR